MTLANLHDEIVATIARIRDEGQSPEDVPVTLQLNHSDGDQCGYENLEICWDNNTQATGCVIVADLDLNQ